MKNLFDFSHLKGDLLGGLTAGVVALPLALAFGVQSGMGAIAGLYGAIFIGFVASLFGGTNTQISGPTAPMTAVSMVVIAGIIQANEGSLEAALPSILIVFLLTGLFQIILGSIGLGKYIKYIPYPVVSGFMTGIGVIILITQLLPALGYYPKEDAEFVAQFRPAAQTQLLERSLEEQAADGTLVLEDLQNTAAAAENITEEDITKESRLLAKSNSSGVIGSIKTLPRAFNNINYTQLILALITVLVIFGFKRITTTIPSTLVALLLVSAGAYFFLPEYRSIGDIPTGLPMPHLEMFTGFSLGQVSPYIFTALTLALLGAIDSLLTSVVADNMTKTQHSPNKELVGQGIGNSVASIFGGIPGAGATIRTVVNINAGGRTRLSGMIAAVLLFVIMVGLGNLASIVPAGVLAGILITVGIGVLDKKGLRAITSIPKSDVAVMLVVLVLTVTWDLVYAVGIGLVMASLIFMKKMGDFAAQSSTVDQLNDEVKKLEKDSADIPTDLKEEVYVKEINGPLFFGSTTDFKALARTIPDHATHVLLRLEDMTYVDQSGLFAMEDVITNLYRRDVKVLMIGLQEQPRYRLEAIDIIPDLVKEEQIFDQYRAALKHIGRVAEDVV